MEGFYWMSVSVTSALHNGIITTAECFETSWSFTKKFRPKKVFYFWLKIALLGTLLIHGNFETLITGGRRMFMRQTKPVPWRYLHTYHLIKENSWLMSNKPERKIQKPTAALSKHECYTKQNKTKQNKTKQNKTKSMRGLATFTKDLGCMVFSRTMLGFPGIFYKTAHCGLLVPFFLHPGSYNSACILSLLFPSPYLSKLA